MTYTLFLSTSSPSKWLISLAQTKTKAWRNKQQAEHILDITYSSKQVTEDKEEMLNWRN